MYRYILLTYLIFLKQNSTSTGFYPSQMPINYPETNWKTKKNLVSIKCEKGSETPNNAKTMRASKVSLHCENCIYPCITRPPFGRQKNKSFLFLSRNFLEKPIFYLRIFFRYTMVTQKKICPELFYLSF